MKRYAIWNKQDPIITPVGEIFTAEQWKRRYPVAALDDITVLCGAGEINGSFFGTLGQMVQMYEEKGADFSDCETAEQKLQVIENFDELEKITKQEARQEKINQDSLTADSLASIAASLEYQNLLTLEDVGVVE